MEITASHYIMKFVPNLIFLTELTFSIFPCDIILQLVKIYLINHVSIETLIHGRFIPPGLLVQQERHRHIDSNNLQE